MTLFPRTKFRVPKQSPITIERPELARAIAESVNAHVVTLLSAPAGHGKTTALVQSIRLLEGQCRVLWISLDEADNSREAFLLALLGSLQCLELQWEAPLETVQRWYTGTDSDRASANAVVVNALAAHEEQVVIVLDDFHHLRDSNAVHALSALIMYLPANVSVVVGSRVLPALPLPKLRARHALGFFNAQSLQFSEDEALVLLASNGVKATREVAAQALMQTMGWAAGLALLAQAAKRRWPIEAVPQKELFDFLAQEVLSSLAPPVQQFVLDCSILDALTAETCAQVTGVPEVQAYLDALRNANLVSPLGEGNAYRLHELVRAFLLHKLSKTDLRVKELHRRAAEASKDPGQAAEHFLRAGQSVKAAALLERHGYRWIAAGQGERLVRVAAQLPEDVRRAHPAIALYRGLVDWSVWDVRGAMRWFRESAAGFRLRGDSYTEARALFALIPALMTTGELDEARALCEEIEPHFAKDSAEYQGLMMVKLSVAAGSGRLEEFAALATLIGNYVRKDATDLREVMAFMGPGATMKFLGFPGAQPLLQKLVTSLRSDDGAADAVQGLALTWSAWERMWAGDGDKARSQLVQAEASILRTGIIYGPRMDALRIRALLAALAGDVGQAERCLVELAERFGQARGAQGCWEGAYLHFETRIWWLLRDAARARQSARKLAQLQPDAEWPFMRAARDLSAAYVLMFDGAWAAAGAALDRAAEEQGRYPMPAFCADAQLLRAYVAVQQQDSERTNALRVSVLARADDNGAGLISLERQDVIETVLGQNAGADRFAHAWAPPHAIAGASGRGSGPKALSDRERRVLELISQGASNKHIARALSLSLHTVKRHVANIIGKLDVRGRGEAAALYNRSGLPA